MAALVQTYPQQTTMLQARPSSTSGIVPSSPSHANHPYMGPGSPQSPRSPYHGAASSPYRGNAAAVQPYAFTSTPNLHQTVPRQQQYGAFRAGSMSGAPGTPPYDLAPSHRNSPQLPPAGYSLSFGVGHGGSRDDSVLTARNASPTPRSPSTMTVSSQPSSNPGAATRNAPERYRRSSGGGFHARSQSSTLPSSIAMVHPSQPFPVQSNPRYSAPTPPGRRGLVSVSSLDDIHLRGRQHQEDARRMHRRSLHGIDASDKFGPMAADAPRLDADPKSPRLVTSAVTHSRSVSSESVASTRSSQSRRSATNRSVSDSKATPSSPVTEEASPKTDQPRLVNIPPRGSSSDATKRTLSPSPLSKPATMAAEDDATANKLDSPAAKQLAAINQKGSKTKSKTSRLRRAFSFGSAADFRKAAGGDDDGGPEKEESAKLHKEPTPEEAYDAEQARIAEAQEAAGIGSSIYGGRFFGSTDNISISSTASSASVMIRKMGRGMKKGTRSLVGLFRPKSVTGIPPPDAPASESSQAAVSMITVEAEAQRVNVTADPAQANGGTGFPHLERNSLDAARMSDMAPERLGSSDRDQTAARKSIVGGDKERAEALAAVRKGILKRERSLDRTAASATADGQIATGSTSPSARPVESSPELALPNILGVTESPNSTAPSTPNDESQGHKRTGSISIGNEDYFVSALRLRQETRSPPATPQGATKRSATFSPRIVFYDTWPSQEYDRRGNIATCNRLTPMLAQQIKEELNNFKMKLHGRAFYESIGSPKFVVAPMVDQSEFAWRMLTRSLMPEPERGRLLAYTPMLHARMFANDDKYRKAHFQPARPGKEKGESEAWLDGNTALGDRPLFVQFCANEPDTLLEAAKLVAPYCDAVDLNLGCPQGIARKGRYGAFLQEDQELIFRLIDKLHRELDVPVTAKIRILDDREETLAYARNVLKAGASILTVHGRTREQKSHLTGVADWDTLRFLRENLPPETVIFANGNILQPGDVERCLTETGADAVMSAEGNLSDPAIFANGLMASDADARTEYWYGLKEGHGQGWRVDAVMRRYLDILHVYAMGSSKPPLPRAPKSSSRSPGTSSLQAYEAVLKAVEGKVAQGLMEYTFSDGSSFDDELASLSPRDDDDGESSARTLRRCRRPWWVAQPIVRPLPAEALKKGAIRLKKSRR
ncbi:hypothetical protein CP533_2890 [Ophiocordyceps camponoti-saundersi (nom. inval.)]|nr:hypothetical protein CP533_2890 [Ophiocordyceps camponoti-saundersi (nom. inval.)]